MYLRAFCIISLLAGALCVAAFGQERTDDVIRVDTSLVNIPVIVSDRDNRYIPGLNISNFKVLQDGVEQKIEVFASDDAPMSIVLALDTSKSTQEVLGKIKKAAKEFVNDLDAEDRCMIVSFDNNVEILSGLTADHKALQKAINHAKIGDQPGTLLQDALYSAVNVQLRPVKGRKAIILLTDGKDFGSIVSKNELLDRVTESDTVIYPIFYETRNTGRAMRRGMRSRNPDIFGGMGRRGGMGRGRMGGMGGRFPRDPFPRDRTKATSRPNAEANDRIAIAFLQRLAEATGGYFYKEENSDLEDAFRRIADEMKRQYVLGFYPGVESINGNVHTIKVKVDRDGAVVRSKGAYRTQTK